MKNKKGFTMIELLIVLVIIGILAAVATPLYLANTQRARATDAVATMSLVRQALRDYRLSHNTYFTIKKVATTGQIQNALPDSVGTTKEPDPGTSGVEVNAGIAQYFSNSAYSVLAATSNTLTSGSFSAPFSNPNPVEFLISVDGSASTLCSSSATANCAVKATEVKDFRLEMDNSGRIFVSYDGGGSSGTWVKY